MLGKLPSIDLSKPHTDFRMLIVFQLVKQMLNNSSLSKLEKSPSVMEWESSGQPDFNRVFRQQVVVGFRQFGNAMGAQDLLPPGHWTGTGQAKARKKQRNEIIQNGI